MAEYKELVEKYTKRRKDTLLDAVTTGLSYADEVAVDLGLLDDTGVMTEIIDRAGCVLPFAAIAITEEMKVIMGKKDQKTGFSDAVFRMLKTGTAMAVGAAVTLVGLPTLAALPAAVGTRTLLDKYKSRSMLALRVRNRTMRLQAIRDKHDQRQFIDQSGIEVIE